MKRLSFMILMGALTAASAFVQEIKPDAVLATGQCEQAPHDRLDAGRGLRRRDGPGGIVG
jgi:hypothetical protein